MNKIYFSILIICAYSFPYAFFSMYLDYTKQSMLGYLAMIAATFLLAFVGRLSGNSIAIIIGNILSLLISLYFVNRMGSDWGGGYFKPFTPIQLVIVVSVLNTLPQLLAVTAGNKVKNRSSSS